MPNKYINDNTYDKKRAKYKLIRLFGLLFLVIMLAVACSKDDKTSEIKTPITEAPISGIKPTSNPTLVPEPTDEPALKEPTPEESVDPSTAPTITPKPTMTPKPTTNPQVTEVPTYNIKDVVKDFKPISEVVYGKLAIAQGDYVFYRAGKFNETSIVVKNIKTSKEATLVSLKDGQLNPSEMYLLGNNLYYLENDDIYCINVDGENKSLLFKGTASILGMYKDDIVALDKKTKEIIRINTKGEKDVLVKVSSINPVEVVVMEDGIYYINKKSNNTLNGNNPTDRLYFIDFDGNNKTEIDANIDIYNLKSNGKDLVYISVSDETKEMKINRIESRKLSTIHTITKEELENLDAPWYLFNTLTLLGVNDTHVYYGINTDSLETLAIYSVKINDENPQLYISIKDLPEIDPSAYFSSGMIDEGYLKIVLDCDTNPVQVYMISLKDKSSILFEGGYYNSKAIDILGESIYYLKTSKRDPYMDYLDNWEYSYSEISSLK